MLIEYPLYLQYSAAGRVEGPLSTTLIAQAIAKPIPVGKIHEVFGGWDEEVVRTTVARGWFDDYTLSGNKSPLRLRSFNHPFADSGLHRPPEDRYSDFSVYRGRRGCLVTRKLTGCQNDPRGRFQPRHIQDN